MKTPSLGGRTWPVEPAAGAADAARLRPRASARAAHDGGGRAARSSPSLAAAQPLSPQQALSAGQRFSALLDTPARAVAAYDGTGAGNADTRPQAAHADSPMPGPLLPAEALAREAASPAMVSAAAAASGGEPRAKQAHPAAKAAMPEDDVADLLDEVAELVCMSRGRRAQHWSVSVWLREAVLRDTHLALTGEPGRIEIRFSSTDPDSLRRLHARHDDLQTRLHERLAVPHLRLAIEATHTGQPGNPGNPGEPT
jgi:Type III secretion protein (HpaP)